MSSQLLEDSHELLDTDAKVLQNSSCFLLVFFYVTKDSFCEVLDHIFSFSLFFFEARLDLPIITLRLNFKERAVRLVFKYIL
jgi:hypothetical protein